LNQAAHQKPLGLGLLLLSNIIVFYLGFTREALTVGTTVKKEMLGFSFRLIDERASYSLISAILKLWEDGNHLLFIAIFTFSVIFPGAKILGNLALWMRMMSKQNSADGAASTAFLARWLHVLGRWSMVEVFAAGLLCVILKLGDIVRVKLGPGLLWFLAAVVLSMINAKLTEYLALRNKNSHGASLAME
jgi:Paraquat-inducible protein A